MQQGIQLYSYWKSRIEEMGSIRTAWFTTFNLDIGFFEKYILSALIGIDPRDMSRPEDYEAINSALRNEKGEEQLDVRVFYDARALVNTGKPKLTTVDLHAIDPQAMGNRFAGGVFHPKVALFENDRGQYWLLTGSFNMTLSGWARNRECFFLQPIEDADNAIAVHAFFSLLASLSNIETTAFLQRLRKLKSVNASASWKFRSSLNDGFWLDELRRKGQSEQLRIWSPYFSENLCDVITQLQTRGWNSIELIPATNELQKIRIETANFKAAQELVHFMRENVTGVDPDVFVHAKVWLTSNSVAIGSWNMTQAGMNLSDGGGNNIEAGVVIGLSASERQSLEKTVNLSVLTNPTCCDAAELKEEDETAVVSRSFVVDLLLDWEHRQVRLLSPDYESLRSRLPNGGSITVPGLGQIPLSHWNGPQSIQSFEMRLLTDRFFTVNDDRGQALFQGYMRERGLSFRPVNGYQNLSDCMMSWMNDSPERHSEWQVVNYSGEVIEGIETNRINDIRTHNYQGWFNTFYALECLKKSISEAKKSDDRDVRLRKIGRVVPGNISEIRKHLVKEQEQVAASFSENGIYLWFIISKFNTIIHYYNRIIKHEDEFIENMDLPEKELKDLLQEKYGYSVRQINQWTAFVNERLS